MTQISMKQLAAVAGLDVSTVSRALRGERDRVADSTIARVQELARELGYVADPVAASLRSGRSRMIGVLVHSLTDIVMGHLVTAIDEASQSLGYLSTVVATNGAREARGRAIERLLSRRVDGLILCETRVGEEVPSNLAESGLPYVFAMRPVPSGISVTADDRAGGALVGKHFVDSGHRMVAIVPGPKDVRTAMDRAAGFASAIKDAPGVDLLSPGRYAGFDVEVGYKSARAHLQRKQRPSAIFCVNDHAAIGAGRAIVESGFRIGRDVALVGYNDIPQAAYLETPLSSVRTDVPLMGRTAADQLVAVIEGRPASSILLEPRLIVRESSSAIN